MRESIKAIKWCGLFSAIFLVATYLLTVNAEGQYISVDLIWISNSFLVTVFGGVFASMIVVFLCEIRKYLSTKSNTERFLFYQALYLYQALKQMEVMINDYLSQPERVISENLMDESVRMAQMEICALEQTRLRNI